MPVIETDYLVVGAGASGMAFVDALIAHRDVDVVLVDRRHRPGGHWLDAYPFVRLHQPSALYGVASARLGEDRIDETGPNAGFYERATAAAVCDYYNRVLEGQMLPSGKVRFLGMHDYRGEDAGGHHIVSLTTGTETTVRVRRRLVDATYIASEIPSRHRPSYAIEPGARVVPPNALVELEGAPAAFTVVGAGKTAMDTCCWLLDNGVDPDRIRWIRPSDPWVFDRAATQPLDLVASYMHTEASWAEAVAQAEDGPDFARRLEAHGVLMRFDAQMEPQAWRGATVSRTELEALRSIERVQRGRVLGVTGDRIVMDTGEVSTSANEIHIDCTAAGLSKNASRPIFASDRLTVQYLTVESAVLSAATIGMVESLPDDDAEKNRICPPLSYTGKAADVLDFAYRAIAGMTARLGKPEIAAWHERCRLNPISAARKHRDDPALVAALARLMENIGPAMQRASVSGAVTA